MFLYINHARSLLGTQRGNKIVKESVLGLERLATSYFRDRSLKRKASASVRDITHGFKGIISKQYAGLVR